MFITKFLFCYWFCLAKFVSSDSFHTTGVTNSLFEPYFLLANNSFILCLCYLQGMFILRQICQISEEKFESQLKDIFKLYYTYYCNQRHFTLFSFKRCFSLNILLSFFVSLIEINFHQKLILMKWKLATNDYRCLSGSLAE